MTREEAIQTLLLRQHEAETRKILIEGTFHCKSYAREEIELYDMAIAALREQEERSKVCNGCRWKDRHQKCSCCRRNRDMKDCYEVEK